MDVPIIESERLVLRGHRLDDYPSITRLYGDAVVMQHISGRAQNATDSWARMLRYVGHWQLLGYGFWAVEERGTGLYLGDVGFGDFRRDISPPLDDLPEAGWVFGTQAHGKGFALEAMRAALAWMDTRSRRTQCIITLDNHRSRKLATKLGYVATRETDHGGSRVAVWLRES